MADVKPEEGPVEHVAVTGRPQDTPLPNTTFAERAQAQPEVAEADVSDADAKPAKKAARKK